MLTPRRVVEGGVVKVERTRISSLGTRARRDFALGPELLLLPALVNVHDHLRGDYLPRIGPQDGLFYLNWSNWERDLRGSPVLVERANVTVEDAYLLGAYKNLFSGVVTVNDHFPHEFNEPFIPRLPIRVIGAYTLAHECSSFDLRWGDGMEVEHRRAVQRGHPFITHLEEGFDAESQAGLDILERSGCLDSHDLLIHCIGFSESDVRKVRQAGASVAWCPASNLFMFNTTCKIRRLLEEAVNVAIGTDSTHTGSVNLLEEMRFARRAYRRLYGEELPARKIVEMVTVNPARAFWMQDRTGSLEPGLWADLLAVRRRHEDPHESVVRTRMEDIELLLREGQPVYAAERFEGLFGLSGLPYTTVTVGGRRMCVAGEPAELLRRVRRAVGFNKVLDYLPFDE